MTKDLGVTITSAMLITCALSSYGYVLGLLPLIPNNYIIIIGIGNPPQTHQSLLTPKTR